MKNNVNKDQTKNKAKKWSKVLIIILSSLFLFYIVYTSILMIDRQRSFDHLKKELSPEILSIISDQKLTSSDVDAMIKIAHRHTYESFICAYNDGSSDCPVPSQKELKNKYIMWGKPASDFRFMVDLEMRDYIYSLLKNKDYYYHRYTEYPDEDLNILFNSRKDNKTIMLQVNLKDYPREISSFVVGETEIFDYTF